MKAAYRTSESAVRDRLDFLEDTVTGAVQQQCVASRLLDGRRARHEEF